ncbi:MAG: hypothetical protein QS99_C0001G0055 [archaeon GW2011_AR4]|nr:MAG: hypothetical protein QS99_C0001G0055 [archaeon GW2011_AR4]
MNKEEEQREEEQWEEVFELDESDIPVHEKFAKEKKVKK